jgi:hypothetical protein
MVLCEIRCEITITYTHLTKKYDTDLWYNDKYSIEEVSEVNFIIFFKNTYHGASYNVSACTKTLYKVQSAKYNITVLNRRTLYFSLDYV